MNRTLLFFSAALAISPAFAQDTRPSNPTPGGMLVPLMSDEHMRERAPRGQGELVFNQDRHAFYYFNGTDWEALLGAEPGARGEGLRWTVQRTGGHGGEQRLTTGTSGFWDLTGNAATDPATDFIGTTDAQPLKFRVNNTSAGQISSALGGVVSYGTLAGATNTTGFGNTFIGEFSGNSNTTGGGNTFLGRQTGQVSNGSSNTFIGQGSGQGNTSGNSNTFIGLGSGNANTNGAANTYVGARAGFSGTIGGSNVAVGFEAGFNNSASIGTFLGFRAGLNNTTGASNLMVGHNAGLNNTTGGEMVVLGAFSGATNTTGSSNVLIGHTADVGSSALTNATAIGTRARVDLSNAMVLGSINGINGATSNTNVGIGTTTPADRLHVAGNIRMVDGNQAPGKVLTSDANGTGTWQTLPAASADWGRTGNAGTNASTNFIGTTDAVDFKVRTNNAERVTVSSTGKVGFGTNAPSNTVSVNGGLALLHTGNLSLVGGANTITVSDRSMFRFSSSVAGASIVLGDGISIGQLLLLQYASGGGVATVSIADNAATSNCNLQAARTLGVGDTIILMWDGLDWLEIAFANN